LIESEFAIVGGGPGGIAAAIEAAKAGVNVTLLDENERLGGQIYRQLEKGFKVTDPGVFGIDYEKGLELLSQFNSLSGRIQYLNNATVWGIFQDRTLAFTHGATSSKLSFRNLLLATGAYDRPVPFPGWTLPGVFTAGGAQKLVKTERVLPGKKILLAGTGPLQLVLAYQILKAGGKIEAILEASDISINWLKGLKGIWGNWDFLKEGWEYLRNIQKADVPLLRSHMILEAHGDGQVEEAVIAKVDKNWRPRPGTARQMQVDTICLGYGLVSTTEVALLAECDHTYDLSLGGFIPVRNENLETTVPGIYAVGDGAGVAGSKVAIEEGLIAGVSVARSLGYTSDADTKKYKRGFQKRLDKLNRFRKVLDEMSMPRAGLYELAKDDTIVCRCEEITLREIKDAMADGATHTKDIKRMTRVGMGPCEGRMCGPALIEMMRCQPNAHSDALECLPPRPSIKPIPLGALAASGREDTTICA
jgi:NADPH-dependent 2,4-dienoyl-CoA reductase/sulfur reductase-like enzyme